MQNFPDIKFGIDNPEHKQFDDAIETAQLQHPIIYYCMESVVGIKIKYRGADGTLLTGACGKLYKITKSPGIVKKKLIIQEGDCIQSIHGYKSQKHIHLFGFTTYRGISQSGGRSYGEKFSYCYPDQTFSFPRGTYDKFIESLTFRAIPLTGDQIQKFSILENQVPKQSNSKPNVKEKQLAIKQQQNLQQGAKNKEAKIVKSFK